MRQRKTIYGDDDDDEEGEDYAAAAAGDDNANDGDVNGHLVRFVQKRGCLLISSPRLRSS